MSTARASLLRLSSIALLGLLMFIAGVIAGALGFGLFSLP